MISGHSYIREDSIMEITVYLVCQWHNCEDECEHTYDGSIVAEVCATKQLADQLLAKRGGHSYGYVTTEKVITKLNQASY